MNTEHLEYFVALAKTLNFTQAAASMHIAQPALSRYISNMEEELGGALFYRDKRIVKLTEAGKVFLEEIQATLIHYNTAVHNAMSANNGRKGKIRMGYLQDARNRRLPSILSSFSEKHPDIEVMLKEYGYFELMNALQNHEEDVAIMSSINTDIFSDVEFEQVDQFKLCAVMHESHPFAVKEKIHPAELKNEPFLFLTHHPSLPLGLNAVILQLCADNGFLPKTVGGAKIIPSLLLQVECQRGITILPEVTKGIAPSTLRFVELENSKPYIHVIIWKKENYNPSLPVFINLIRNREYLKS